MEFEVRETDLLGRIGTIRTGGKKVETPCLLPVIHPVNQQISVEEIKSAGFDAIMTNSLILYSRRREESLEKGLHRLLGFDGLLMTDSGGYQVLRYGEVDVDYRQIADFQSRIGSDFAVTLDNPTGYSESRSYARATMENSLKKAVLTIREFSGTRTVWVGPVQGGIFLDLLKRSARGLLRAGFEFLALGSPTQVMENYRYNELVRMVLAVRGEIPYSVPLHLFGAGHTLTMAIAVALGCDTFDSASYMLFAREGRYMDEMGVHLLEQMKYLPCSCKACNSTSAEELKKMERPERTRKLAMHNLLALKREIEACKQAISEGRLWDLVEQRSQAHPMLKSAFLELARDTRILEEGTPPMKEKGLFIRGEEDMARPELRIASRKLSWALSRRGRRAVLIISHDTMPSVKFRFKGELRFRDTDFYRLHKQLGPYPVELDFVYPFTQTVAAHSLPDRNEVARAVRTLRSIGYSTVRVALADENGLDFTSIRRLMDASPSPPSSSARLR